MKVLLVFTLDVSLKTWDLGPDGGDKGGTVVFAGSPEELIKNKTSYTGEYLKKRVMVFPLYISSNPALGWTG